MDIASGLGDTWKQYKDIEIPEPEGITEMKPDITGTE